MWESRKMLFGENAIRRPQLAANGQQLIVRSLADYTVGACTWQARYDYVSITYTNICACFPASPVMYAGYTIIPEWAPHVGAPTESESVMYGVYTMIRKGLHVASPL